MNQKDIESLRLLANNTAHLIELIMARLCREAREIGHEMAACANVSATLRMNGAICQQWYTYCKKCVYDIDLDCIPTELGEEKIYIKHTGKAKKCPSAK